VLAESYARGWSLRGLPRGWSATHLRADGYANGWRIDGSGDAELTLEYRPARFGPAVMAVSALTAAAAAALALGRALRRRRR
jgi:arabinofuranan 3-O-arabinosyltransferase